MLFPPAWSSWLVWHWGGRPNHWHKGPPGGFENYAWQTPCDVHTQRRYFDAAWKEIGPFPGFSRQQRYIEAMKLADKRATQDLIAARDGGN